MSSTLAAIRLTFLVASFATAANLAVAAPLAWVLRRRQARWVSVLQAILLLPMAVPPTAVGLGLLLLLGDDGPLGRERLGYDLGLLFSLRGAVLASAVVSFPLVFRTTRLSFDALDPRAFSMARSLGLSPLTATWRVLIPLTTPGLATAAALGFIRAMGEFGATILVAGNIPGETQTLPLALYAASAAGERSEALTLLAVSCILGLVSVLVSERLALRAAPVRMER